MLKFLATYLLTQSANPNLHSASYSKYCLKLLQRTLKNGVRHLVPSIGEMGAIKNALPMDISIKFLDGSELNIKIDAASTVLEVLVQTIRSIGLASSQGWALYEVSNELGEKKINFFFSVPPFHKSLTRNLGDLNYRTNFK